MPVNTQCREYAENLNCWQTVRDCIEGDEKIKARGEKYLPRLSDQSNEEYRAYQKRAVFFDATSRTAEGLHGHIFSKDPSQTGDISEAFKNSLNDIDAAGTRIDQFASNITWDALHTGWGGLLVDHSPVAAGTSLADKAGGAFLKWYSAESIINWRYSVINNVNKLSLVVLREDKVTQNANDEFVYSTNEGYRVLSFDENGNYIQRIFEKSNDVKDGFAVTNQIIPLINGKPLDFIPFYTCPGETPEKSMILGLAYENIGYYQKTADYENGLHYTGVPSPIAENMEQPTIEQDGKRIPQKVLLGSSHFQFFYGGPDSHVNVKYLEFSGSGLTQLSSALNACLDRMAKLGIQAIGPEKNGVEAAETAQIHRVSENGVLGAYARNMSDKLTQAIRLMAKWNAIPEEEADGWSYELNHNFNYDELSAQILAVMHTARQSNEIPRSVWFNTLKQADKLPEDMTFEDFLRELEVDQVGSHGPDGNEPGNA